MKKHPEMALRMVSKHPASENSSHSKETQPENQMTYQAFHYSSVCWKRKEKRLERRGQKRGSERSPDNVTRHQAGG